MTETNMTEDEIQAAKPWYKQPWLLFILTPIFAVVFYGFGFLYLSIVTMDGVVKDDYYRIARGYELNTEKNQNAIDQKIVAELNLDDVTGDIMIKLNGQLTNVPEFLTLDIVHPTHQKYDQVVTLKAIGSQQLYSGSLANPLKGKRFLFLFPPDENWHLRTEILPPYEQRHIEIKPNI